MRYKHGLSDSRLYGIWSSMRQRCNNSSNGAYKNYGGRGIVVCESWQKDFAVFHAWAISAGWQKGLQIDRIDNDGNYAPSNCHFITQAENKAVGKRRMLSNISGVTGVHWCKKRKRWRARITVEGRREDLGFYVTIERAREARVAAELRHFGTLCTKRVDQNRSASAAALHDVERKLRKDNGSGYEGVRWQDSVRRWRAYLTYKNNKIENGYYTSEQDAIAARRRAEVIAIGLGAKRYQVELTPQQDRAAWEDDRV